MSRRLEQFHLPEGIVIIEYPEAMSTDDVSDLALYFDMLLSRLKRMNGRQVKTEQPPTFSVAHAHSGGSGE